MKLALQVALIVAVLTLVMIASRSMAQPLTQIPTNGNTLDGSPFFGPDADPFLGIYTGAPL